MNNSSITVIIVLFVLFALFLASEYYFMDVTDSGWRRARKDFPQVAKNLDLQFTRPKFDYEIGEISGFYRGYDVKIMPDSSARIQLDMGHSQNIELDTVPDSDSELIAGFQEVNFESPVLNKFFGKRLAKPGIAEKLAKSDKFSRFIEQFRSRWGREIYRLRVENGYIRCSFPHGRKRYIPARLIEPVLKDLADMADILKTLQGG